MANDTEAPERTKVFQLGLIKDVLGISVILGGFLSSVVAGAIWIDDLNDRLTKAEADIETSTALISAQDSVLMGYEQRLKALNAPNTQPPPSLKEQQCVDLAQQRRSARGKTAAAVQAAMTALGCGR